MTLDDAREAVEYIRKIAGDDEVAHSKEDDLHQAVLFAIMDGHPQPQLLARIALQTQEIKFARWCA